MSKSKSAITKMQAIITAVIVIIAVVAGVVYYVTLTPSEEIELRILGVNEPHCEAKRLIAPEYEEMTGVKVTVEQYPYDSCVEKQVLELSTGSSTYDIACVDCIRMAEFVTAGWLENLVPYMENPDLPDIDLETLVYPIDVYDAWDLDDDGTSEIYGIVNDWAQMLLVYRTDLFEQAGIVDAEGTAKPPETWDEFFEDAKKLTMDTDEDGTIDVYGTVLQLGGQDAGYSDWTVRLVGFPPDEPSDPFGKPNPIFDRNFEPLLDSPHCRKALEDIISVLPYAAPGSVGFDYPDAAAVFRDGKCAMYISWSVQFFEFDNPEVCEYADVIAYAPPPYYTEAYNYVGGWRLCINKASQHKVEAYKLLAYLTSEEGQTAYLEKGSFATSCEFG